MKIPKLSRRDTAGVGCLALTLAPVCVFIGGILILAEHPGPDEEMEHMSPWVIMPFLISAPILAVIGIVMLVYAAFWMD